MPWGELLLIVEAMKMELRAETPADGVVTKVLACSARTGKPRPTYMFRRRDSGIY